MIISRKQAQAIALYAAALSKSTPFGSGKNAVFKALNHLGYVQIDTISVIARAHHHVLATRVSNYQPNYLSKLQEEQKILEYWSHAAAYLPMTDYRFTLPLKKYFGDHRDPWPKSDKKLMQQVYDRIKTEGPLMARDFSGDRMRKGEGWWDWKPAKLALERLFLEGSLVTVGRSGFQKIYDIPENVIPSEIDVSMPSNIEFAEYLINRALQSLGIVTVNEVCYLRKNIKVDVKKVLSSMVKRGQVVRVGVHGLAGQEYFVSKTNLDLSFRVQKKLHLLSPFDNFTIQRNRLQQLFNYDYQIECYVPKTKRKWGYFCLPILYGYHFIGRVDAKADRKAEELIIQSIYLENDKYKSIPLSQWYEAIDEFAKFNKCTRVKILTGNDKEFVTTLRSKF
ncbi:MAG: winged helix-turn-helix domain-containing protein [Saprospiraceae bacterium]|nr:winged helix-turn-helix domain-containing protein [Saprospiraceae bacterium]